MLNEVHILQEAIHSGILSVSEVDEIMIMTYEKLVKDKHPYAINNRTSRKGIRYITKVREDGKLKQITACSEKELLHKLYFFYFDNKHNLTLNDLFPQWKTERLVEQHINIKTVRRNCQHWDKYYKDNALVHVPIFKLTTKQLNDFFNTTITEFQLSNKEYNNMKSIMIALLLNAIDQGIIVDNPMKDIYIKAKFRAIRKQNDGSKVYLSDEHLKLLELLEQEDTMESLCIQLMFQLAVRIGESVALKFTDITYGKIFIQRMEEKVIEYDGTQFKSNGTRVVEHLKKENSCEYRYIPLTDKALSIIAKTQALNPDGDFMFVRDGERLTARAVVYWLEKYCRRADVTYKSPHSIRRTTASLLHMAGNAFGYDKRYTRTSR